MLKNIYFFNIKNQHKDSREDFSPWHNYFFQQFMLCKNFYVFARGEGGLPTYLKNLMSLNCLPTMVDCGPTIKQHCARGMVCWTHRQLHSISLFFFPRDQPTSMGGKPMGIKTYYGDGHGSCMQLKRPGNQQNPFKLL